jgi:tetraacyldisaccharide 4'-kinase
MRARLEAWLQERWYGGVAPGFFLRVLAGVYRVAIGLRLALRNSFGLTPQRVGAAVVVVGNFTAGGTGKTPLILALAQHLQAAGWQPGIVSRGHGRRASAPVRVQADTPVDDCGDEPKLLHLRSGLPVFVDADRVAAAQRAVQSGCDLVLSDDGMQQARLHRDVEIEVLDGERRLGNGLLLPAGPLRERPRDTGWRVLNGGEARAGEWPMRLALAEARALAGDSSRALSTFVGRRVDAIAGIGHPQRFFAALRSLGLDVAEHPFPDHHRYTADDFAFRSGPLLMTEKDAVKCLSLGLSDAWVVPALAVLPPEFLAALERTLRALPR